MFKKSSEIRAEARLKVREKARLEGLKEGRIAGIEEGRNREKNEILSSLEAEGVILPPEVAERVFNRKNGQDS